MSSSEDIMKVEVLSNVAACVQETRGICHKFQMNGQCEYEGKCRYAHVAVQKKRGICHQFRKNGRCKFEERCWWRDTHVAPTPPDSAAPSRRGSLRGRGPGLPPAKRKPRLPRKVRRALEEGKDTELRPPVVAADSVTVSKGVVLCVVVAVVVSFACAVAGTYWLMR